MTPDLRPRTVLSKIVDESKKSPEKALTDLIDFVGNQSSGRSNKLPCGCHTSRDGFVTQVTIPCVKHIMDEYGDGILAFVSATLIFWMAKLFSLP